MSLKNIQNRVNNWISQYKLGYFKPLESLARITEETGELARELNHRFGPKKKKSTEESKEIGDEISDLIFTIICLANSLNIDLDEAFTKMMQKLENRDNKRWERK